MSSKAFLLVKQPPEDSGWMQLLREDKDQAVSKVMHRDSPAPLRNQAEEDSKVMASTKGNDVVIVVVIVVFNVYCCSHSS